MPRIDPPGGDWVAEAVVMAICLLAGIVFGACFGLWFLADNGLIRFSHG